MRRLWDTTSLDASHETLYGYILAAFDLRNDARPLISILMDPSVHTEELSPPMKPDIFLLRGVGSQFKRWKHTPRTNLEGCFFTQNACATS
jgi:hypothetical protein